MSDSRDRYASVSALLRDKWLWGADRYKKLAIERADEGTGVQLACLVLAEHCARRWAVNHGGPTPEMIALAENTVGECLNEVIAAEMARRQEEAAP